jgi:hypothetical protein
MTTAKQGQLQPSTKTLQIRMIQNPQMTLRHKEITLKRKKRSPMYNLKPTGYGQRKVKRQSYKMPASEI